MAMDPTGHANPRPLRLPGDGPVRSATARVDEAYLHLDVELIEAVSRPVTITLDVLPELTGDPAPGTSDADADVALQLDPLTRTGRLRIHRELDAAVLDGAAAAPALSAASVQGWVAPRLLTNRAALAPGTGTTLPPEYLDLGELRWGSWDPSDRSYDSRASWRSGGRTVRVRLPWALVGMSDPSSHQVLVPAWGEQTVTTDGVGLGVTTGGQSARPGLVTWKGWERVAYRARLKAGAGAVRDAFTALTP